MTWVIRHPKRGIYTGEEFSKALGKNHHRFSIKRSGPGKAGGVQFETAQQAQTTVDRMTAENFRLKRCYVSET